MFFPYSHNTSDCLLWSSGPCPLPPCQQDATRFLTPNSTQRRTKTDCDCIVVITPSLGWRLNNPGMPRHQNAASSMTTPRAEKSQSPTFMQRSTSQSVPHCHGAKAPSHRHLRRLGVLMEYRNQHWPRDQPNQQHHIMGGTGLGNRNIVLRQYS